MLMILASVSEHWFILRLVSCSQGETEDEVSRENVTMLHQQMRHHSMKIEVAREPSER